MGIAAILVLGIFCILSFVAGWAIRGQHFKEEKKEEVSAFSFVFSLPFALALITMITSLTIALFVEGYLIGEDGNFLFSNKTALAVSKEFFFASFIALFIIMTVEAVSRREQTEFLKTATLVAKKSVLQAVYESRMPPEIFREVEESIYSSVFVREHHARSMVLRPIEGTTEHVILSAVQKYRLRNVTDKTQASIQNIHVPISTNPYSDITKVRKVSVKQLDGEAAIPDEYPLNIDDEGGERKVRHFRQLSKDGAEHIYKFPSINVGPGAMIEVEIEFQLAKDLSDNELLTFLSPTLAGEFSLRSEIEGLRLKAISMHREALEEAIESTHDNRKYRFNTPILPNQGYMVFWGPETKD